MGTSTIAKLCIRCGENVSRKKRTKDAAGNYYCAGCWNDLVSEPEHSNASKDDLLPAQVSDRLGQKAICGIVVAGAATIMLAALVMYLTIFRGAWERENKGQIELLIAAAESYARREEWERAHDQYTQLFELLGDRSLNDENLTEQIVRARNDGKVVYERVATIMKARKEAELRRLAREEEAQRIKVAQRQKEQKEAAARKIELEQQQRWKQDATRKYVESCEPFVREMRAMTTRIDSGMNYKQYIEKLGALQDSYAQIGDPPERIENAESFDQHAQSMMRCLENAAQAWSLSIDLDSYGLQMQVKRDWETAKHHAKLAMSDFRSLSNDLD